MMRKVALLDDDVMLLHALNQGIAESGFSVRAFSEPKTLLLAIDSGYDFDVFVIDYKLPEMSGIDLLKAIKQKNAPTPVIFISGYGTIPVAVEAIHEGAVHFLEKPIKIEALVTVIKAATEDHFTVHKEMNELKEFKARYNLLPTSQRRVMDLAIQGYTSKEIALQLNLTTRTVDTYRLWIMEKMDVETFAELVRKATIMALKKGT
jgi:two-component system response regulator FixJ